MEGYMKNSKGHLVPVEKVPELDRVKDDLITELLGNARKTQEALKAAKLQYLGDVHAFVELSAEKYKTTYGGKKGNVTLVNFDGTKKVAISIGESIGIDDEKLKMATALINEYLDELTEDSPDDLRTLVDAALRTDDDGRVNIRNILGLMRLEITNEKWGRAMSAVRDGLRVDKSKSYIRFHERQGPESKWEPVSLDFAAL